MENIGEVLYKKSRGQLNLLKTCNNNNLPSGWTLKDYKEEKQRLQKIVDAYESQQLQK